MKNKNLKTVDTLIESNTLKRKKERAITLIALVITIVVLIILAGVLINISLGNNGLFYKAKTAKEMYTNAQTQEELDIAKMTNQIDGYVDGNRGNITLTDEEYAQFKALVAKNNSNYSTSEQVVGTWIDGKDIYRSTINVGYINTGVNTVNVENFNIDTLIKSYGTVESNTTKFTLPYLHHTTQRGINILSLYNNKIEIYVGSDTSVYSTNELKNCKLIIEYTKTTN